LNVSLTDIPGPFPPTTCKGFRILVVVNWDRRPDARRISEEKTPAASISVGPPISLENA